MQSPEPGTKFVKNNKEYVVVPWDPKRDGYKAKVVAKDVECKDHNDWCLGMDVDAWKGNLERGCIVTFVGERPEGTTIVTEQNEANDEKID